MSRSREKVLSLDIERIDRDLYEVDVDIGGHKFRYYETEKTGFFQRLVNKVIKASYLKIKTRSTLAETDD